MKKLMTIALALCAVIAALACGSSIRDAASKTTVESWLKKLGVDKQSTGIQSARTRSANSGRKYALSGQPANCQSKIYIQNNKKFINK